ncbi:hypothetical protein TNCV_2541521 [Trichonephila clavipes]|nr:hypothetical protein TNCV_2541521 [Trichonephila clavipes]
MNTTVTLTCDEEMEQNVAIQMQRYHGLTPKDVLSQGSTGSGASASVEVLFRSRFPYKIMIQIILMAGRRAVLLSRWIVRSVPLEIVGSSGHEKVPTRGKPGLSDQEDHEERRSKDRVASTCGPYIDSFNNTSRRRHSNCSINNFQAPCRSKS